MFAQSLSQYWWILLVRGILATLFGLSAFLLPGVTLATLVLLFAAFAFVDGLFETFHAVQARGTNEHWWLLLLEGLLGVLFGIVTFQAPDITTLVLLMYIAAWAIVSGLMRIVLAFQLRREIEGEWLLALGGLISLAFGIMMIARPGVGALAVIWFIGTWALIIGAFLIALAFKARKFPRLPSGAVANKG
jgi:uncharacterized membrane protein HdeD (DUF308 family)